MFVVLEHTCDCGFTACDFIVKKKKKKKKADLSDADVSVGRLLEERPASTADQFSAHPGLSTKSPQAKLGKTNRVQSILEAVQKIDRWGQRA